MLIIFEVDQYTNYPGFPSFLEFLEFQKYSNKSDFYRLFYFDRFCFLCVVCLFWWLYGFLWWVFAIEKLECNRYNARTKYELVWYRTYSSNLFSYTNGSHEGFCWVLCDWSFQVLGYLTMDEGIRSKKSLSLGMPRHPQLLSKNEQATKLGDAPSGIPCFF